MIVGFGNTSKDIDNTAMTVLEDYRCQTLNKESQRENEREEKSLRNRNIPPTCRYLSNRLGNRISL